jgi:hypothetical protein
VVNDVQKDEIAEQYRLLALDRRQRASLHTRADTWRAAAVMTCFLWPLGVMLGVAALVYMKGIGALIDHGPIPEAEKKLARGRLTVLVGTALGAFSALGAVVSMIRLALQVTSSQMGGTP